MGLSPPASAATRTWTGGGGVNTRWSLATNWNTGVPQNGDSLEFPANLSKACTNDLTGRTFAEINFTGFGSGWILRGNPITLSAGINDSHVLAGENTVALDIVNTKTTVNVAYAAGTLTLSGVISGDGGLVKTGLGELVLSGPDGNSYDGLTTIVEGTLILNKGRFPWVSTELAVPHGLEVGDGMAEASVLWMHANQVKGSVTVRKFGRLNLDGHDNTIGNLTLLGGTITSGAGTLALGGQVTASTAQALIFGNLDLGLGPRTFTVADDFAGGDLMIYANLSGGPAAPATALRKLGPGQLHLSGTNTFDGALVVDEGVVTVAYNTALGTTNSGTVVASGATLEALFSDDCYEPITLAGSGYIGRGALHIPDVSYHYLDWKGRTTLAGDTTIRTDGGLALYEIAGTGPFRKKGPRALYLNGPANYTGTTCLDEGQVTFLGSPSVPGALVIGQTNAITTAYVFAYEWGGNRLPGNDVTIHEGSGMQLGVDPVFHGVGPSASSTSPDQKSPSSGEPIRNLLIRGGVVDTRLVPLCLLGQVRASSTSSNLARIVGASGILLEGGDRTFDVYEDNPDGHGLQVLCEVKGNGGIIKQGPGHLLLGASNSFAGMLVISNGIVVAGHGHALGNTTQGTWVQLGSCLVLSGTTAPVSVDSETLHLHGFGRWLGSQPGALRSEGIDHNRWNGPIILENDPRTARSMIVGDTPLRISGIISGPGELLLYGLISYDDCGVQNRNLYTNATEVHGTLRLERLLENQIHGPLSVIGTVEIRHSNQIQDTVDVRLDWSSASAMVVADNCTETVRALSGTGRLTLMNALSELRVTANSDAVFYACFSGHGTFYKAGQGKLRLDWYEGSCPGEFTGSVHVLDGLLELLEVRPLLRVPFWVVGPGQLAGACDLGDVTAGVGPEAGAKVMPGRASLPPPDEGDLRHSLLCSNLSLGANSELIIDLKGTNGNYREFVLARGTVTLSNPQLRVNVLSSPAEAQQFVLIANDGVDAIIGAFAGLPSGSVLNASGLQFCASYTGGDGNDFSLTVTNVALAWAGTLVAAGNGNGEIEPGECNLLYLALTNKAGSTVSALSAVLHAESDGVFISQAESVYDDIPPGGVRTNQLPFAVSTSTNFSCGERLQLLLSLRTADHGSFSLPVSLPTGLAGTFLRYDNNTNYYIAYQRPIDIPLPVAGFTSTLAQVEVSLHITHPSTADLALQLIAPDGTSVELTSDNGGAGDNYGADCLDTSRTRFTDLAAQPISVGQPPFVGAFKPEQPLAVFRGLSGYEANGTWTLRVEDDFASFMGTVRCVSLFLAPAACGSLHEECHPCVEIAGVIDPGDRNFTYLMSNLPEDASKCGFYNFAPAWWDFGKTNYFDQYIFTNYGPAKCVGVAVTELTGRSDFHFFMRSVAVLGTHFNPGSAESTNILGSLRFSSLVPFGTSSYSFQVPANTEFSVIILFQHHPPPWTLPLPAPYLLRVSNFDCDQALAIQPSGPGSITVTWPTSGVNYRLHSAGDLNSAPVSFTPVPEDPLVLGTMFVLTNRINQPQQFYILKKMK